MQVADATLVARATHGDVAAFGTLVERHRTAAFTLAYARLGSREDALDAAQEAFVEAFAGLSALRDPARFRPWLATILSRRCAAVVRDRLREARLAEGSAALSSSRPIGPHPWSIELAGALAALSPVDRRVFTLAAADGLAYREVASRTGMTVAAVRSRLHRARTRLAKELRPMSEAATTQLSVDVMRRVLARMAEMPQPITAPVLAAAASQSEDPAVAHVAAGLASVMQRGESLDGAMAQTGALPRGVTGILRLGNRLGWGELALRTAARALGEGVLQPGAPVEPHAVALWCACMASLFEVGTTFIRALEVAGQVSPTMGQITSRCIERLLAGDVFSRVLADLDDTFTESFCGIVRLGEVLGILERAMSLLAAILWAPETLDQRAMAGPWQERVDEAMRALDARDAWRAVHPEAIPVG